MGVHKVILLDIANGINWRDFYPFAGSSFFVNTQNLYADDFWPSVYGAPAEELEFEKIALVNNRPIISFSVDGEQYLSVSTIDEVVANQKTFYYNETTFYLYVHFANHKPAIYFSESQIDLGFSESFARTSSDWDGVTSNQQYKLKLQNSSLYKDALDDPYVPRQKFLSSTARLQNNDYELSPFNVGNNVPRRTNNFARTRIWSGNNLADATEGNFRTVNQSIISAITEGPQIIIKTKDIRSSLDKKTPTKTLDTSFYPLIKNPEKDYIAPEGWGKIYRAPCLCLNEEANKDNDELPSLASEYTFMLADAENPQDNSNRGIRSDSIKAIYVDGELFPVDQIPNVLPVDTDNEIYTFKLSEEIFRAAVNPDASPVRYKWQGMSKVTVDYYGYCNPVERPPVLWNKMGSLTEVTNSENGPDGVVNGTITYEQAKFNDGARMEALTDFITFALTLPETGTISIWYKANVDSSSLGSGVDLFYASGGVRNLGLEVLNPTQLLLTYPNSSTTSTTVPISYTSFSAGDLINFTLEFNSDNTLGAVDRARVYQDGNLLYTNNGSYFTGPYDANSLRVGGHSGFGANAGALDNVVMFDYYISDSYDILDFFDQEDPNVGEFIENGLEIIENVVYDSYNWPYNSTFYDIDTWEFYMPTTYKSGVYFNSPTTVQEKTELISADNIAKFVWNQDLKFSWDTDDFDGTYEAAITNDEMFGENYRPSISSSSDNVLASFRVGYAKRWAIRDKEDGHIWNKDESFVDQALALYGTSNSRDFFTTLTDPAEVEDYKTRIHTLSDVPDETASFTVDWDYLTLKSGDWILVKFDLPQRTFVGWTRCKIQSIGPNLSQNGADITVRIFEYFDYVLRNGQILTYDGQDVIRR